MSYLRTAPWGAVCLCFAAACFASPAPPALRAAVHQLWANNPEVEAARAALDAARARTRAAEQPVYNPSLALEGENADVDRRTVGLSLPLDLSGKRRARTIESEAAVRAAEAQLQLQRREVAARWLKAWSSATSVTRQRAFGLRRVATMQRFDVLAAQRLAVGDIATSERDLAALGLAAAQMQEATLAGQEASALGVLAALGGAVDLPEPIEGPPPAAATFVPLAVDERTELLRARATQERAQAAVAVAERQRRPDPTLSLTGGSVRSGTRRDRVVGVAISVPLPVLNSGRAEVAAAMADADTAVAAQRAARMEAEATLEQARVTYEALRQASQAFRDSRAQAFDARTVTLDRLWQASELDTSDYLVQLNQSFDTAQAGLVLQAQLWQAWFDYLAAAGRLDDWIESSVAEIK
jgi:cobalt-zinc-cadmium efflux system outer membrane protein